MVAVPGRACVCVMLLETGVNLPLDRDGMADFLTQTSLNEVGVMVCEPVTEKLVPNREGYSAVLEPLVVDGAKPGVQNMGGENWLMLCQKIVPQGWIWSRDVFVHFYVSTDWEYDA